MPDRRPRHARLIAVILFVVAIVALFEWLGVRDELSLEMIRAQFEQHWLTGSLSFILLFALGNLIHIPGWLFLAAAVLALGKTWGGLVTYVAASISCVLTYLIIRFLGGNALRTLEGRLAQRFLGQLDSRPLWSQFWLRTFFQTAPPLNYALALSGVRLHHYATALLIGLPLPIALYCVFFDQLAMWLRIT